MLLSHLEEILRIHAAGLTGKAHAHEGHRGACALIGGRHLHSLALAADELRRGAGRIHEGRVALQILYHLLVILVGLDAGNTEGDDLHAAQVAPLGGKLLVESIRQLRGVAGERRVADAHLGYLGEGRLERRQQLRSHLSGEVLHLVVLADVAADVAVEQQGVGQPYAVLAEALDADIDIYAGALIDHPEGDGRRRAVLVADELLGVEVVDSLVLGRLAAEGETLADVGEDLLHVFAQISVEYAGLSRHVVGILAGLGADVHDLALLDDEHALSVRDSDERAV